MKKVKLGDICEVFSGYAFKVFNEDQKGKPVIKIGNIKTNGNIDTNECVYTEETPGNKYLSKRNDIYIALSGATTGKTGIMTRDGYLINQRVGIIRQKKLNVSISYLYAFLQTRATQILQDANGAAQPNISPKDILNYQLFLPSLEEQKEIAERLDKVSDLIEKRKTQLKKLDDLVKSRFIEMFKDNSEEVLLKDYVWFQEGPGVRSVDFRDEGTILLTGSNINNNKISFGYNSDRYISDELANGKYAHFICKKGDILVVASAIDPQRFDQKVCVVDVDNKYCLNTGIIRFRPNEEFMLKGFFQAFLKTDYFKGQVSKEMRGVCQMHFGPSHLKSMKLLLPKSFEAQKQFVLLSEQTDKSKFEIQKSLEKLEILKKSLMQQYFG